MLVQHQKERKNQRELNKWYSIFIIRRLSIVTIPILPHLIYGFKAIPISFCRYWKTDSKVYMERQESRQHSTEEEQSQRANEHAV